MQTVRVAVYLFLLCVPCAAQTPQAKSPPTLDEFFNSMEILNVRIAPDGRAVVIETSRADWKWEPVPFRPLAVSRELRFARPPHSIPVTTPAPRGRRTASGSHFFRSDACRRSTKRNGPARRKEGNRASLFEFIPHGGEAFPVTHGDERGSRLCLVPRFWNDHLRNAHLMEQRTEGGAQKGMAGRSSVPRR